MGLGDSAADADAVVGLGPFPSPQPVTALARVYLNYTHLVVAALADVVRTWRTIPSPRRFSTSASRWPKTACGPFTGPLASVSRRGSESPEHPGSSGSTAASPRT
ncbi:hypothetical protein GCM10010411_19010 [Actinomadura fulvescens]|uniref:Uncharacterized protein n=1 Tax=Actinomadura fulvescens TaxID=46160 RepID=A0ABN3PKN5_9ACTN